ncbi:hypothetical protein [Vibrio cincinnatiensis]
MKSVKFFLFSFFYITLIGCQSSVNPEVEDDALTVQLRQESIDFMSRCDNADSTAPGPIKQPLYVVGSFPDANWKHVPARQYQYKGNNFYQAVTVTIHQGAIDSKFM